MPELGPYGSVRGARGNSRPYRESSGRGVKPTRLTCRQAQWGKGVRLHRARIAVATDAGFDPRSEDSNGACKTPQMDRRGDKAADRTRAAEGKSASDGERAWTSHRLRQTTSSRIGFASAAG